MFSVQYFVPTLAISGNIDYYNDIPTTYNTVLLVVPTIQSHTFTSWGCPHPSTVVADPLKVTSYQLVSSMALIRSQTLLSYLKFSIGNVFRVLTFASIYRKQ